MKNIALLVPELKYGGAERVVSNLSIFFSKYYNVYLIVHDGSNIAYPYEGTLIDLKLPANKGFFNKAITLIRRVIKLRKIKRQYKIDYTISHLPPSNIVNVLSRNGDKIFTYVHSMLGSENGISLISKFKERFVAYTSDKVIVVSERARLNLIENFGIPSHKTVTIYNFIDDKGIKEQCDNIKNNTNSENIVVCMGRLTKAKGQWHLLRAFSEVVKVIPDSKLVILGDGELRTSLENLAEKLGILHNVEFVGFTSKPFEYIKKSKVFVSSSLWEGLPMALIEVAMCGKVIIATDCDAGCREIIAPNTDIKKKTNSLEKAEFGILVPVCNGEDLNSTEISNEEKIMSEAIVLLLRDHSLRQKYEELSEELYKRFLPESILNQWNELLELNVIE